MYLIIVKKYENLISIFLLLNTVKFLKNFIYKVIVYIISFLTSEY